MLAESVYGDVSLRQFVDLDILVHKSDICKAKDLLACHGYNSMDPEIDAKISEILESEIDYHLAFIGDGGALVELHWKIESHYRSFPIDSECIWELLVPIPFAGTIVPGFPREILLQIVCVHGARHYWNRLSWICDVAELVRDSQCINWRQVLEQAKQAGSQRILLLGLFLAWDLLGARLPEEVFQRIRADPLVAILANEVCKQHILSEFESPPTYLQRLSFWLRLNERIRDKILFSVHLVKLYLWPSRETGQPFATLPKWLSFPYYLIRPIRLIWKYAIYLWNELVSAMFHK